MYKSAQKIRSKVSWSKSLCGIIIIKSSDTEEKKRLWQTGVMEIWGLTVTSNQTPSETFGEMCVNLACVNCVPSTCEGKMTFAHQEENKGKTEVVVVVTT